MKSLHEHIAEALDGSKMTYSGKNREFVDVILENPEGKILILRRANYMKNFRACWGVIGGAVDVADKTPKDAAVRETAEETGISLSFNEVNNMKQLFDYKYKDGNVSHVFWTRLETKIDKVKISREHSKYEWIDFSAEKIDDRKWMPEVFNILQKWEQKPVNEKLVINKDYNSGKVKPKDDDDFMKIIDDALCEHFNKFGKVKGNFEVIDLNFIDTSDVKDFSYLFDSTCDERCKHIRYIDISDWDTSSVEDMHGMFTDCVHLESIGDISGWNVRRVSDFGRMFKGCYRITEIGDLSKWNVLSGKKFNRMFVWCSALKNIGNISGWNLDINKHDIKNMFKESGITKLPSWYDKKCCE